jgi:UPF0716 family protein affecting phage T7 exclusion
MLLFAAALVLIKPGIWTDLLGLGAMIVVVVTQQAFKPTPEEVTATPPGE